MRLLDLAVSNFFGVVILIELIIKCIIRLDRFVRILKDLDGNDKK
jgi:hypothetical protein